MPEGPPPKILLTGAAGQIGWELRRSLAPLGRIVAADRSIVDLRDEASIRTLCARCAPDIIVNAAAYTAVDAAEGAPEEARAVNTVGPAILAEEAARRGALMVHFSTDFVFDGQSATPYRETDISVPLNVYGATKLAGDVAVLRSRACYVLRVAWVYSGRRNNFLTTIRSLATKRSELRIVADQHGGPTWSRLIAEATLVVLARVRADRAAGREPPAPGIYHLSPPDHTTWHEFAKAIVGALPGAHKPVVAPITTDEYPTTARRPAWSVLDSRRIQETFGVSLPPWREQLELCLDDLAHK